MRPYWRGVGPTQYARGPHEMEKFGHRHARGAHHVKTGVLPQMLVSPKAGREAWSTSVPIPSEAARPGHHLDLGFWPPEPGDDTFLLFKPLGLWDLGVTGPRNTHRSCQLTHELPGGQSKEGMCSWNLSISWEPSWPPR